MKEKALFWFLPAKPTSTHKKWDLGVETKPLATKTAAKYLYLTWYRLRFKSLLKLQMSQPWWYMPLITALEKQRQADLCEF